MSFPGGGSASPPLLLPGCFRLAVVEAEREAGGPGQWGLGRSDPIRSGLGWLREAWGRGVEAVRARASSCAVRRPSFWAARRALVRRRRSCLLREVRMGGGG